MAKIARMPHQIHVDAFVKHIVKKKYDEGGKDITFQEIADWIGISKAQVANIYNHDEPVGAQVEAKFAAKLAKDDVTLFRRMAKEWWDSSASERKRQIASEQFTETDDRPPEQQEALDHYNWERWAPGFTKQEVDACINSVDAYRGRLGDQRLSVETWTGLYDEQVRTVKNAHKEIMIAGLRAIKHGRAEPSSTPIKDGEHPDTGPSPEFLGGKAARAAQKAKKRTSKK